MVCRGHMQGEQGRENGDWLGWQLLEHDRDLGWRRCPRGSMGAALAETPSSVDMDPKVSNFYSQAGYPAEGYEQQLTHKTFDSNIHIIRTKIKLTNLRF